MEINKLLELVVKHNASDLHLTVDRPPVLRVDGGLQALELELLKPSDTESYVKAITPEDHLQKVQQYGGTDFGFSFGKLARFRVSVYKQKGYYGLALRMLPTTLLTFEQIGLPPIVRELIFRPRGLILVTGPTGSGKTTTLASLIDIINKEKDCHILTIEDPIEYYHEHKQSVITQREVGVDVTSFSEAIMRGLRQDPDVILIGEMRDLTTMEAAIVAAETGHLVFATTHTTGAARTVDRIIDAFPTDQQEQIRMQLSTSLVAVISQLLLPRVDGKGRVGAFEIMVTTPSIQNLIRENKTFRIPSDIQTGARYGMVTLDTFLIDLYEKGIISYEELIYKCSDQEQVALKMKKTDKK
jgi:twitching motility protein PilT